MEVKNQLITPKSGKKTLTQVVLRVEITSEYIIFGG